MKSYKELVKSYREKHSKWPKTNWRYESWFDSFEQGGRVKYRGAGLVDHGPAGVRQGYAGKEKI